MHPPLPLSRPSFLPAVAALLLAGSPGLALAAEPAPPAPAPQFQPLFNGRDFSGLDLYLAPDPATGKPLGLNNDPRGVFKVEQVDGRGAIHVSGEIYGAITTQARFTNAHIRVQFKWGDKKWPPRNGPRHYRDAGLLYWCTGPHGAGSDAWMRSVEFNIMEKGQGQWWSVAGAFVDVNGRNVVLQDSPTVPYRGESDGENCVVWDPAAPHYTVQPWEGITSPLDPEKPHGQWNTAEVYAWGNTCIHLLNGQVVLVVSNPRHKADGREIRLSHGAIQLQSEAAELWYRDLEARPIPALPPELHAHVPPEPADESGFIPLLSTSTSSGWAQCGPGRFTVQDGVATGEGGMGLWWYTNRTFANFILRGEWRQAGANSDSGVFFRFPNPGQDPWVAVRKGHEFEIGDARPATPMEGTGAFYPFAGPARLPLRPPGEWNRYELTCIGPNYTLRLNDVVVNTWTDTEGRPREGHIGIQNYPYPDAVQHRYIRIKPIL